ncbi:exodeoxyribonuclease VII small subunit [Planctomycetaceae bacterium SH139]
MAKKKMAAGESRKSVGRQQSGTQPDIEDDNGTSFEEALAEVEQIVRELEGGQLTLGESLKSYERGVSQLRKCHDQLRQAERRVEILSGFDAHGNPITETFDSGDEGSEGAGDVDDSPGLF